jgi:hypothetical protein
MIDLLGRAPGRALSVEPVESAVREALSARGLGRAFSGAARVPSGAEVDRLLAETRARLDARLLDLVGLARRAGMSIQGMDSVLAAIAAEPAGLVVVLANDLAERSNRQVEAALASRTAETAGPAPRVVRVGSKADLGSRLGRDEVGVIAVRPSTLARRLAVEADRRAGLQGLEAGSLPGAEPGGDRGAGSPRAGRAGAGDRSRPIGAEARCDD